MWTDGQRTKTRPKTSSEQSAIFQLVQEINKTNCSITRKTAPPPRHFKLDPDFIGTNLLTKFHEDRKINVASRVFTNKCGRMDDGQRPVTKAHLSNQETKVLSKFHENWAKNSTSRVLTCFHYIHIQKNTPPTGGHVISPIWTIFKLVREINKTNVLTNFHDDWAKIVTSRVLTRKTAPPTGGHVFQRTGTTFELNQHIIKINILTKLHEDWLLTKFHEDWTINVASRVLTNKY
ncbi:hypothetical protein DPMN_009846 [Dreissena polymorpha]|uniref:Uncharacterized protein n=1 Tax=Dreissena polymorpha TaxID=45954 RepID=A0A9D4MXP9_DREPO|nr:hypothetical protein DPMN_009846 [Dreissena polymorpha]